MIEDAGVLPFDPSQLPAELRDPRVLAAMEAVPRRLFVPAEHQASAHQDVALPLPYGQSISQPLIVAWMSAALEASPGERVLEIGTGSGYQTAVLAAMGLEVWTIEVVPALAADARRRLEQVGLARRIHFRVGDGRHGWPGRRDFDGVLCAAAPARVPAELLGSLGDGGRMVIPVGDRETQHLRRFRREGEVVTEETLLPVRFVPLVSVEPQA